MEKARVRTRKITLKKYLDFFHFGKQIDITVDHLNQIIFMHGFRKLSRGTKKVISEAMESLDLMNLSRSTLKDDGVSSCAAMNLEDIIADLNEIKWQDCSISSLETIKLTPDDQSKEEADLSHSNGQVDGVETGRSKLKYSRKRKNDNSGSSIDADLGSSSSALVLLG